MKSNSPVLANTVNGDRGISLRASHQSLLKVLVGLAFLAALTYFAVYQMALFKGLLHDLGFSIGWEYGTT